MVAPALDEYVQLIAFDFDQQPYLFTKDPTRCLTSSQWSAYCKGIFKRWSGIACPPKMLVSSASHATPCNTLLPPFPIDVAACELRDVHP